METRPLYALLGLLATAAAADVYKWTDENGVVHYSDQPHPDAEVVELPKAAPDRPEPWYRPRQAQNDAESDSEEEFSYTSISISKPAAEETLWNIGGVLDVSLTVSPALRPGHSFRVHYDGKPQLTSSTTFQLQEVYRGAHNLQVEVIDESGKMMIRSQPSRFYVHQSTVQF